MKTRLYWNVCGVALCALAFGGKVSVLRAEQTLPSYGGQTPWAAYQQTEASIQRLEKKIAQEQAQIKAHSSYLKKLEKAKEKASSAMKDMLAARQEVRRYEVNMKLLKAKLEKSALSAQETDAANEKLKGLASQWSAAQEKAKETQKAYALVEKEQKVLAKEAPKEQGSFSALRQAKKELEAAQTLAKEQKPFVVQEIDNLPPPPADWTSELQSEVNDFPPPPPLPAELTAISQADLNEPLPPPPPMSEAPGAIPPPPPMPGAGPLIPPPPPMPGSSQPLPGEVQPIKTTTEKASLTQNGDGKRPSASDLLAGAARLRKTESVESQPEGKSGSLITQASILEAKNKLKKAEKSEAPVETAKPEGFMGKIYDGMSRLIKSVSLDRDDVSHEGSGSDWSDDGYDTDTVPVLNKFQALQEPEIKETSDVKFLRKEDAEDTKKPEGSLQKEDKAPPLQGAESLSFAQILAKRRVAIDGNDDDDDWDEAPTVPSSIVVNPSHETSVLSTREAEVEERENHEDEEDEEESKNEEMGIR